MSLQQQKAREVGVINLRAQWQSELQLGLLEMVLIMLFFKYYLLFPNISQQLNYIIYRYINIIYLYVFRFQQYEHHGLYAYGLQGKTYLCVHRTGCNS